MRLPRMTTRRWMIAVAFVALMLAVALWVRRENERRELARQKELFELLATVHSQNWQRAAVEWLSAIRAQPAEKLPDDFGPWFSDPPDPPEPK